MFDKFDKCSIYKVQRVSPPPAHFSTAIPKDAASSAGADQYNNGGFSILGR